MTESGMLEQLRRDVSEVILLESLNAQRIDHLSTALGEVSETIRGTVSDLALSLATQSQALKGFRELYAREIEFIQQSLGGLKEALDALKASLTNEQGKITAVERDIAVTRGSIKGAIMSWSGFVALIAFVIDKAVEMVGRK